MLRERLLGSGSEEAISPPSVTPRVQRVDLLDNAKAVLIICVVLYHTAVVYVRMGLISRAKSTCLH